MRLATGARVVAEDVALVTREGPVYTGVDFTARPGTLTVFQADSGGGRSALLLTLTGRMRPTSGNVYVDGHELPRRARRVRRISALGLMTEVNALDERLRVGEHLSEAALLRFRPAARGLADDALEAADLGDLDRRTLVKELDALQRRRLGVALALMAEPRLLAVDDVDGGLSAEHQALMWHSLKRLTEAGLTVIATCADADALAEVADTDTQGPLPIDQGETSEDAEDAEDTEGAGEAGEMRLSELFTDRDTTTAAAEGEDGDDRRDR